VTRPVHEEQHQHAAEQTKGNDTKLCCSVQVHRASTRVTLTSIFK